MEQKGLRSSAGLYHDFLKWCVAYWGSKHYKKVEMEALGETSNDSLRPDVVLRYPKGKDAAKRANVVYVEVQHLLTLLWEKEIAEKYEGKHLVVIALGKYHFYNMGRVSTSEIVGHVLKEIAYQMDNETRVAEPKTSAKRPSRKKVVKQKKWDYYSHCDRCGARVKNKNLYITPLGKVCKRCRYSRR